jgi:Hg(II)-responsive transcriptional regulator
METELTRGKVAKEAGVNVETLRYYEDIGIIPEPIRSESGYRLYTEETIQRIRFVKDIQMLGFTLHEIKELLDIKMDSKTACGEASKIIHQKKGEVKDKIASLNRILETLQKMEQTCSMNKTKQGCPILESLSAED